jgi:hypothetical protein
MSVSELVVAGLLLAVLAWTVLQLAPIAFERWF